MKRLLLIITLCITPALLSMKKVQKPKEDLLIREAVISLIKGLFVQPETVMLGSTVKLPPNYLYFTNKQNQVLRYALNVVRLPESSLLTAIENSRAKGLSCVMSPRTSNLLSVGYTFGAAIDIQLGKKTEQALTQDVIKFVRSLEGQGLSKLFIIENSLLHWLTCCMEYGFSHVLTALCDALSELISFPDLCRVIHAGSLLTEDECILVKLLTYPLADDSMDIDTSMNKLEDFLMDRRLSSDERVNSLVCKFEQMETPKDSCVIDYIKEGFVAAPQRIYFKNTVGFVISYDVAEIKATKSPLFVDLPLPNTIFTEDKYRLASLQYCISCDIAARSGEEARKKMLGRVLFVVKALVEHNVPRAHAVKCTLIPWIEICLKYKLDLFYKVLKIVMLQYCYKTAQDWAADFGSQYPLLELALYSVK